MSVAQTGLHNCYVVNKVRIVKHQWNMSLSQIFGHEPMLDTQPPYQRRAADEPNITRNNAP